MKNILIVSGHTDLRHSFSNRIILEKLETFLPGAVFDYLDREYPHFSINVGKEQEKLMAADVIVLQFPVFWYSFPSLMHRWMEDVFVHGFAHGSRGKALHGKKLLASFTTGAPEAMYTKGGPQLFSIDELIIPALKSTANLCGMEFAGYVYTGGVNTAGDPGDETLDAVRRKAEAHADRLKDLLDCL